MKSLLCMLLVSGLAACNGGQAATSGTGANGTGGTATSGATESTGTSSTGGLPTGMSSGLSLGTSTGKPTPLGLWIGGATAISPAQLTAGAGMITDTCPAPGSGGPYTSKGPAVVDGQGDLWVQYTEGNNAIYMWTPSQLAESCASMDAAVTLTSSSFITLAALAFDSQGNLWASGGCAAAGELVTDCEPDFQKALLLGYRAEDLKASGDIQPSWQLTLAAPGNDALSYPAGLAFDHSGTLWVGASQSVLAFSAATLAAATTDGGPDVDADGGLPGTAPPPDLQIATSPVDDGGSEIAEGFIYQYVAFDRSGNLWATLSPTQNASTAKILEFSAAELASLGTDDQPVPVTTVDAKSIRQAVAIPFSPLAFDAKGNLWVGFTITQPNLFGFTPAGFESGPDVVITVPGGTYGSLAFNPIPAGLPIQPGG